MQARRIYPMFKSLFPKFNKESFAQRLESVPKEFHKYMVEQQRFIRLRQSAQALLKRKKPLLEEMVSKVHAYERKNMDVYVLDDPTLTRDLVLIYRPDKSGANNNVSSLEITRLQKKIERYEEEIIKLQEKIYPRGTEETLSREERRNRIFPKGYYKNEVARRRPTKAEHDMDAMEPSLWKKPDTRTPFQKGEIVLSNLQKAGAEGHPVKWETPTDVDTQPEHIPVTYCDHIEEVTAATEPDHEITDEELVKICHDIRHIRRSTTFYNL